MKVPQAFQQRSPEALKVLVNFFGQTQFFKKLKCNNNPNFFILKLIDEMTMNMFQKGKVIYSTDQENNQKLMFLVQGKCVNLSLNRQNSFIQWEKQSKEAQQWLQQQKSATTTPIQRDDPILLEMQSKAKLLQLSCEAKFEGDHFGDLYALQQPDLQSSHNDRQLVLALSDETVVLSISLSSFLDIFEPLIYQYRFLIQYLSSIFPQYDKEKIKHLSGFFSEVQFSEGEVIIPEKIDNKAIYIIRQGCVNIVKYSTSKGRDIHVNEIKEGELFGYESLRKNPNNTNHLLNQSDFSYVALGINPSNLNQTNGMNSFQDMTRIWLYKADLDVIMPHVRQELMSLSEEQNTWYMGKIQLHERTLEICENSKKKTSNLIEHLQKSVSVSNIADNFTSFDFFNRINSSSSSSSSMLSIKNRKDNSKAYSPDQIRRQKLQNSSTNTQDNTQEIEEFQIPISVNQNYKVFKPIQNEFNFLPTSPLRRVSDDQRKKLNGTESHHLSKQFLLPNLHNNTQTLLELSSFAIENQNKERGDSQEYNSQQQSNMVMKERNPMVDDLLEKNQIYQFQQPLQFKLFKAIENSYFREQNMKKVQFDINQEDSATRKSNHDINVVEKLQFNTADNPQQRLNINQVKFVLDSTNNRKDAGSSQQKFFLKQEVEQN